MYIPCTPPVHSNTPLTRKTNSITSLAWMAVRMCALYMAVLVVLYYIVLYVVPVSAVQMQSPYSQ